MAKEMLVYQPPKSLLRVEKTNPLIRDASLPNKELWLLRIPGHEFDLMELSNTELKLNLKASDGNMGDLVHNGVKYIFQRHNIASTAKFAFLPTEDTIKVRRVPMEVSIVRSSEQSEEPIPAAVALEALPDLNPLDDGLLNAGVSDQERSNLTRERSSKSQSSKSSKSKHKRQRSHDNTGFSSGVSEGETVETRKRHKDSHQSTI